MIDYGLIFITGLLTSLHCIGMCGPIVLAYSLQSVSSELSDNVRKITIHLLYNSGRILSYIALGIISGFAGQAIGSIKMVGEYVSIIGGVIMIMGGLFILIPVRTPTLISGGKIGSFGRKLHAGLLQNPTYSSKFVLGTLTPLLPCGILYVMVAKAGSTGNPVEGAVTMLIFGLGMAPALFMIGAFSSVFSAKMRKNAEKIAAIAIVIMGISLMLRGFHIPYLSWMGGGGHEKTQQCPCGMK